MHRISNLLHSHFTIEYISSNKDFCASYITKLRVPLKKELLYGYNIIPSITYFSVLIQLQKHQRKAIIPHASCTYIARFDEGQYDFPYQSMPFSVSKYS